jgi:hypothetical protein
MSSYTLEEIMASPILVKQRPASVLVLAILHLVGGGLGLVGSLCTAVGQAMGPQAFAFGAANPAQDMQKGLLEHLAATPGYQAVTWGSLAMSFVLDVLLLTAGVGLLSMKPWARSLSLVYAPLSILNRLFGIGWTVAIVLPATTEFFQKNAGNDPIMKAAAAGGQIGGIVGMVVSGLVMIYPIVVLIILNQRHVKEAFSGKSDVLRPALADDEGWGPIKRPGASTDVTTDPDRDRFQPPGS